MKKRRLFAALTAAALAVSMTACTSSSDSGTASGSSGGEKKDISEIVVGLSIGNTTEERWNRQTMTRTSRSPSVKT